MEQTVNNGEDLDLVMSMYDLIEYSSNYSDEEVLKKFWKFLKKKIVQKIVQEVTEFNGDIDNDYKAIYFEYQSKLLGDTKGEGANRILKNATTAVTLKYLSNFWKSFGMSLIN